MRVAYGLLTALSLGSLCLVACGGDDLSCGSGTKKSGSKCIATGTPSTDGGDAESGAGGGGGGGEDAGADSSESTGGAAGSDSGVTDVAPPPRPTIEFAGVQAAAPVSADSILLTWSPASLSETEDAVFRYDVFVANDSGAQNFSVPLASSPPGAASLVLEGLPDREQFFVVRAVVEADTEAVDTNTEEISATPAADDTAPTFEGITAAEPAGAGAVRVSWEAASDDLSPPGAMTYQVFWSSQAGQAVERGRLGAVSLPGVTSVVVGGLPAADAEYHFHVKALDAAGNTDANTVEREGTTGSDTTGPVFGGCTSVASPSASGALVSWEAADDDITQPEDLVYKVYAFEVPVDEDTAFDSPVGTFQGVESGEITGLLQGTAYRLVCRAEDVSGNEDYNIAVRTLKTLDDGTPPEFSGVEDAVIGSVEVELSWTPATDDQTADDDIVYSIYAASEPGMQDFEAPPLDTSLPGASGHLLRGLTSNAAYYFVVRARDAARNEDENTNELAVETLVSFAQDVQPIFTANCALTGCHVPGNPPQGQILSEGFAYTAVVDVVAKEGGAINESEIMRVDSTSAEPLDSYLYRKISGMGTITGSPMPPSTSARVLTEEQKDTIRLWIVQGAQNN